MAHCWNQRGSHPLGDRSKNRLLSLGLRLALSVGLFCSTAVTASQAPLTGLAPLRWQQRIILVDGQQIPDAFERLRKAQEAMDERDILWFINQRGRLQSNYPGPLDGALAAELKRQNFSRSDAAVFLIGKDGSLKTGDQHLERPRLFERIDAMPMRRREMEGIE